MANEANRVVDPRAQDWGLYRRGYERDSCGFGLIASLDDHASHWVVQTAITSLNRLTHRGAIATDGKTGDGCGLLIKTPTRFLRAVAQEAGLTLRPQFAAGLVFLNRDPVKAAEARRVLSAEIEREKMHVAGFRVVNIDPSACGDEALKSLPHIEQIFVNSGADIDEATFNRQLYMARRRSEKALEEADPAFYVPSLSASTIVYKGMVMPQHLVEFYPDLADPRMEASVAVFHQRFSTNTLPQWRLAHPYRYLAHNGEINTVQGNRSWAVARGPLFRSPLLPDLSDVLPVVSLTGSDSCSLDNMLELLLVGGLDPMHAMRMLIPPAWQSVDMIDPDLKAFYEYYATHMEPWDGPAGIVLTDGRFACCTLDRNGLRPARWVITKNRHITIASEAGVWDYKPEDVVKKGKLGPGEILALDLQTSELMDTKQVDDLLKSRHPYKVWLKKGVRYLQTDLIDPRLAAEPFDRDTLAVFQKMFNVSVEERDDIIRVLAEDESEAVGSMGDDTPMPVLSTKVRSLYDYFRQAFAQVTNPPIDSLRESIVMSLQTQIGQECNIFVPLQQHAEQIVLSSPVLSQRKLRQIMGLEDAGVPHEFIDLQADLGLDLKSAILAVCDQAEAAVRAGKLVLLLSDRYLVKGKVPIHALLATGAVHHRLVKTGLRCKCNILVETGTARDSHHFACLLGYGATAVYPYLAYQTLFDLMRKGAITDYDARQELGRSYRRGIRKGLFKIMSKMGISTIASYRSAQLFEIVGLGSEVVSLCFEGSDSRIEGADFSDLKADADYLAERAWDPTEGVSQGGLLKFMHGGEYHMYNPDVIATLQSAVMSGDYEQYREYAALVNGRPVSCIRDLLKLNSGRPPIPVEEVEPESAILKRFDSAGMSLGALSPEAHEALAIAMNRLGARSNSGEGGEDPARYGTEKNSKIKQVASGRFGVTPEYLINAEVLQIKIAQGAKPGEGGQLPGHKVNEMIARLRFARPGVGLISPPPHHDIYSIEDLAQLIFDLKQINPQALVSVKLVAEPGVGTVAAGVAKAYADLITVSGYDGGTGASPLVLDQVRRHAVGARARRNASDTARQRAAASRAAADRRRPEDRPRRDQGGHHRGRELRLRHGADGRARLQVPAHLSPQQLRDRRRHPAQHPAGQVFHRAARDGDELFQVRGARMPRDHGLDRRAQHRRAHRQHAAPRDTAGRNLQAEQARPDAPARELGAGVGRAAVLHRQPQCTLRQGRARRADARGHAGRDRDPIRRRIHLFGQQLPSLHRRARVRRDREALGQCGHERGTLDRPSQGLRRPELRRVECGRPAPASRGGGERLRRQGHGRRQDRAEAACGLELRGPRHGDHGQHLSLRGDRRRAVRRGNRRRAFRRAQLRRARGGRGHGRSLLRVHDRRRRLRAGAHRA